MRDAGAAIAAGGVASYAVVGAVVFQVETSIAVQDVTAEAAMVVREATINMTVTGSKGI